MMRFAWLALLSAFLALPTHAQPSSGAASMKSYTASQLLATSCTASNEGTLARVTNSATSLAVAPASAGAATFALTARCHNGGWVIVPDLGDVVMGLNHSPWSLYPRNPLFDQDVGPSGWPLSGCTTVCIWNDPDFHVNGADFTCPDGSNYCGYVSLGVLGNGDSVRIFYVTSTDGVTWALGNSGSAVLTKGGSSDFDSYGVETFNAIDTGIVGSQRYRACYTAYDQPPASTFYTMGCAYSADGLSWTKTGELALCSAKVAQSGNPWGYFACAEPSLRYIAADTGREIKLYFGEARCRKSDCTGYPSAERGIGLAESPLDWSSSVTFTEVDGDSSTSGTQPILRQAEEHDPAAGWDGYSTPNVSCDSDDCLMVVSVFKQDGDGFHQRAIALFSSTDGATGRAWRLDNPAIASTHDGQDWWMTYEVRSGSLVRDTSAGTVCVYFAANSANGSGRGLPFQIGIGRACRRAP